MYSLFHQRIFLCLCLYYQKSLPRPLVVALMGRPNSLLPTQNNTNSNSSETYDNSVHDHLVDGSSGDVENDTAGFPGLVFGFLRRFMSGGKSPCLSGIQNGLIYTGNGIIVLSMSAGFVFLWFSCAFRKDRRGFEDGGGGESLFMAICHCKVQ